jgi:hypothetical protein
VLVEEEGGVHPSHPLIHQTATFPTIDAAELVDQAVVVKAATMIARLPQNHAKIATTMIARLPQNHAKIATTMMVPMDQHVRLVHPLDSKAVVRTIVMLKIASPLVAVIVVMDLTARYVQFARTVKIVMIDLLARHFVRATIATMTASLLQVIDSVTMTARLVGPAKKSAPTMIVVAVKPLAGPARAANLKMIASLYWAARRMTTSGGLVGPAKIATLKTIASLVGLVRAAILMIASLVVPVRTVAMMACLVVPVKTATLTMIASLTVPVRAAAVKTIASLC